jgi:hypothetical protein
MVEQSADSELQKRVNRLEQRLYFKLSPRSVRRFLALRFLLRCDLSFAATVRATYYGCGG